MRSCICVFYICALGRRLARPAQGRPGRRRSTPNRTALASATRRRATCGGRRSPRDPRIFEAAWKLARRRLLARRPRRRRPSSAATRSTASRRAGRRVALAPDKADGHFWIAANMGMLAESLRHPRRAEVPQADQGRARDGAAHRSRVSGRARPIARWDAGTSRCRGCSAAAQSRPRRTCGRRSPTTRTARCRTIFLAELLRDQGRKDEARAELPEGARRAARSGVTAGRQGLEGEGAASCCRS